MESAQLLLVEYVFVMKGSIVNGSLYPDIQVHYVIHNLREEHLVKQVRIVEME